MTASAGCLPQYIRKMLERRAESCRNAVHTQTSLLSTYVCFISVLPQRRINKCMAPGIAQHAARVAKLLSEAWQVVCRRDGSAICVCSIPAALRFAVRAHFCPECPGLGRCQAPDKMALPTMSGRLRVFPVSFEVIWKRCVLCRWITIHCNRPRSTLMPN